MHKNRHDACGSYHLNDLMNLNYIGFFLSNLSVFVSNYNWYLIEEINEVLVVIRSSCPKCLWNFRYNYLPTLHQSSTMYSCTSFFATFMFQNSSWSQFYIQLVNKAHLRTWILLFWLLGQPVYFKLKIDVFLDFMLINIFCGCQKVQKL